LDGYFLPQDLFPLQAHYDSVAKNVASLYHSGLVRGINLGEESSRPTKLEESKKTTT